MSAFLEPGVEAGAVDGASSTSADARPSIGELLTDVSQDLTTLLRQEIELAKAEAKQSAARAGRGAGMLTGAGVSALMVLIFLSVALWWSLGNATGRGWSALIVAAIWLLVGIILAVGGRSEIKSVAGLPRTSETVKHIPAAVAGKEQNR